jgi:hypothetical protein
MAAMAVEKNKPPAINTKSNLRKEKLGAAAAVVKVLVVVAAAAAAYRR